MKLLSITLLIAAFALAVFPQQKPSAELIDEFDQFYCDDFLARMDYIAARIFHEPGANFVILTSAGETNILPAFARESMIKAYLRDGVGAELTRVEFVTIAGKGRPMTKAWLVPKGAEPLEINQTRWNLVLPSDTKATVWFETGSKADYAICPEFDLTESYIALLNSNPAFRAHIVIATTSPEAFEKKKLEVAERLKGIDPSQIRYFFEKYNDSPGYEFWIVPPKIKPSH